MVTHSQDLTQEKMMNSSSHVVDDDEVVSNRTGLSDRSKATTQLGRSALSNKSLLAVSPEQTQQLEK